MMSKIHSLSDSAKSTSFFCTVILINGYIYHRINVTIQHRGYCTRLPPKHKQKQKTIKNNPLYRLVSNIFGIFTSGVCAFSLNRRPVNFEIMVLLLVVL